RTRRDEIERAFAVLGDEAQRAAYDGERALPAARSVSMEAIPAPEGQIDYSPLPPARGSERPKGFEAQPLRAQQRSAGRRASSAQPPWFWPIAVGASAITLVSLITLVATYLGRPSTDTRTAAPAQATVEAALGGQAPQPTVSAEEAVNQFESSIPQLKQAAEQAASDPEPWIEYGNIVYNSVQIVRENMPDSDLYKQRLPRWLEASQAYEKALALQPDNVVVRADMAVSLCNYGAGTNDQSSVQRGIVEAQRATQQGPQDPRALLNQGVCMVSATPPQRDQALDNWRRVAGMADKDPGLANEAQRLIQQYAQ
ncbi:MAG: J domain-containing protein, partial [Chloroflexales bacterium]|nr:J domain-containing protein [Chloroflexales bacterium]